MFLIFKNGWDLSTTEYGHIEFCSIFLIFKMVHKRDFLKMINLYSSVHPEQPLRIKEIYEKHQEFGLLDRVKHVESRKATGYLFSECIFFS